MLDIGSFGLAAFYKWRQRYAGMQASELKRLKELEEENTRLDLPTKAVHLGSKRCTLNWP
jgi:hypothetical protein